MKAFRLVAALFLTALFLIPQGSLAVAAQAPQQPASAAYLPRAGTWKGTTNLGYPVSFTVDSTGTIWTNFSAWTHVVINGCSATITSNVSGPGSISSNLFSGSGSSGHFKFTGKLTSATTATGTYAWKYFWVDACKKYANQTGTWTAKAPPPPPAAFSKSGPANLAVNRPLTLSLSWAASTGAISYSYCFDTTNDSTCDGSWVDNGSARTVSISGLAQATTYYWQARATNSTGTTEANAGAWWSFTTGTTPGAFGKVGPSNGATSQSPGASLSWGSSSGAVSYEYCFDTVNNGLCDSSWINAGTSTTVDPSGIFMPGTTYYWQVRAVNAIGPTDADGGTWWSFSTIPPSQLTLTSDPTLDGWVLESAQYSNVGGSLNRGGATFYLGDNKYNRQYRGILSFNSASIPPSAVVTGAILEIKQAGAGGSNPFKTLGNILVDIKKGTFGLPALQLTDWQAAASKNAVTVIKNTPVSGWYSNSLSFANLTYINRSGLTQFRVRFSKGDNSNGIADYLAFYTGNAATPGNRPILIIQYYVP